MSEVYKQQKAPGDSRQTGKKASEPAVPSGQGIGAAAAAAAPVQQSSAEADEAALRQFDLATKYGPCSGMTRLERCATGLVWYCRVKAAGRVVQELAG